MAVFSGVVAFLAFDRFGDSLLKELFGKSGTAVVTAPTAAPVAVPAPVDEPVATVEESLSEELVAADGTEVAEGETTEAAAQGEAAESETLEGEAGEGEGSQGEGTEAAQGVPVVEPPNPRDSGAKMAPARTSRPKVRRAPRPRPAAAAPKSDSVSAEDKKILDDFDSSADTAPAKIDVEKSGSTQSKNPPLDGDGVRATVTTNKPRLQRCYERAIRGQQSPSAVRLDVTVTVASSGRVKAVNAVGNGPGGLAECVEASVRRWRFPASAEGGPAKFPIVFSAN